MTDRRDPGPDTPPPGIEEPQRDPDAAPDVTRLPDDEPSDDPDDPTA